MFHTGSSVSKNKVDWSKFVSSNLSIGDDALIGNFFITYEHLGVMVAHKTHKMRIKKKRVAESLALVRTNSSHRFG